MMFAANGEKPSRQAVLCAALIIFAVWLATRWYVYDFLTAYLQNLVVESRDFGHLSFPALYVKDHLLKALLYFRQQPPGSMLLLAGMVKLFGWPLDAPYASYFLSVLTLVTAILLWRILLALSFGLRLASLFAVVWVLSADWIVYEISSYPNGLQEPVVACLFAASVWFCLKHARDGDHPSLAGFGICTCLLVVIRSSFSVFFAIPLVVALFFRSRWRFFWCSLALVFQLLFALKNYLVYEEFHFETSSFSGYNIVLGMLAYGVSDDFAAFVAATGEDVCLLQGGEEQRSSVCEAVFSGADRRDAALADTLGLSVDDLSMGSHRAYQLYYPVRSLYLDYLLHRPATMLGIFSASYRLFWGRAQDRLGPLLHLSDGVFMRASTGLIECVKFINLVVLHTLSLWLLARIAFDVLVRRVPPSPLQVVFGYAMLSVIYLAVLSSFTGYGENNRYRLAVEPAIWLMPFLAWRCLAEWYPLRRSAATVC